MKIISKIRYFETLVDAKAASAAIRESFYVKIIGLRSPLAGRIYLVYPGGRIIDYGQEGQKIKIR